MVVSKPNEPARGCMPVRQYHRRDESKILPHVLVISIVSFCAISVLPYFWNYDVLDYSACCFGIRLPMFVQHFTIPGSNSSFNVSSIEKVVCWEML